MQKNSLKIACIVLILFFLVLLQRHEALSQSTNQETGDHVILLHGLGRSNRSMVKIEKSLSSLGYTNIGKLSTKINELQGESSLASKVTRLQRFSLDLVKTNFALGLIVLLLTGISLSL